MTIMDKEDTKKTAKSKKKKVYSGKGYTFFFCLWYNSPIYKNLLGGEHDMYKFPEEIIKRFREIDSYRYQEFDRAIKAYQEILREYAEDGRVVARTYFCLGETAAMMTDFEKSEAYYKLGIQ